MCMNIVIACTDVLCQISNPMKTGDGSGCTRANKNMLCGFLHAEEHFINITGNGKCIGLLMVPANDATDKIELIIHNANSN